MTGREQQVSAAAALSVILQSSAVSLDQRIICSLLQTCHSWRAVVQDCNSNRVEVMCELSYANARASFWPQLDKVTGLSHWIVKYAGLVSSINVVCPSSSHDADLWSFKAAESLLYFSIQQAARGRATTLVDSGQQKPLRLRNFTSSALCGLDIITVLPAQQLTSLAFFLNKKNLPQYAASCSGSSTAWVSALGQLTNLRTMNLGRSMDCRDDIPSSCITGLAFLQQLTNLDLLGISSDWYKLLQQLPIGLQQLQLSFRYTGYNEGALDIRHLSQLTVLQLDVEDVSVPFAPGTALPYSLQSLQLTSPMHWYMFLEENDEEETLCNAVDVLQLTALKQLSRVVISVTDRYPEADRPFYLTSLASITQLQDLRLAYAHLEDALDAADGLCWDAVHLPQLHSLSIGNLLHDTDGLGIQPTWRMMEAVAVATNLTRLQIDFRLYDDDLSRYEVFEPLTALKNLQELAIGQFKQAPLRRMDALHLTCLRALTKLDFGDGCGDGAVGGVTAVALVCNLTNLRWLNLQSCSLSGMYVFPAIAAQLTALQHLDLRGNDLDLRERYMMMLTTLKHLTYFAPVPNQMEGDGPSTATWKRFWAAVRGEQLPDPIVA